MAPKWNNCPLSYLDDGICDCGCQFADNLDCGSDCSCPTGCDWCWCNTGAEDNCPSFWNGDGSCDCACDFADSDCAVAGSTGACCSPENVCSVRSQASCASIEGAYSGDNTTCQQVNCAARCDAGCEACWVDTPREGDCNPEYEGDTFCDCGCQFDDPDCGPRGACCAPNNGLCAITTQATCVSYLVGVFNEVGVDCPEVDCERCDTGCAWCWKDTQAEHACLSEWSGDGECDCGCQFPDPDCAAGVCGDLVCKTGSTDCPDDCKDLRAFAQFQNCFDPGLPEPPQCYSEVYVAPLGVGLEDYAVFEGLFSGP